MFRQERPLGGIMVEPQLFEALTDRSMLRLGVTGVSALVGVPGKSGNNAR
jgi:hypothetical protein